MGKVVKQTDRGKQEVRGFIPGQDNDEIVKTLVAITEQGETHAKVKRKKDGSLCISAVSDKMLS